MRRSLLILSEHREPKDLSPLLPFRAQPIPLLSCQHLARLSSLAATLMDHLASVANQRLTARLSSLDATLT
jgi:hypothetical protein